tara:strand:+ start:2232 stop:2468 length:237 start_codon:yes stop_codon:yes gene_type:complete
MLSGDQVHTERRVRDLRQLGYEIRHRKIGGEDTYCLESLDQDVEAAARHHLHTNVKKTRKLSDVEKLRIISTTEPLDK